ncbi:hypothetical protein DID74_00025 [Candidatus Marinamargulisbacteria bacterium SCGC AG-333-B06]|nr:hypothetical protein DID74_00025 [Candidatus Marinamargulisbacteria bacterium SCGC AG-333-B06]
MRFKQKKSILFSRRSNVSVSLDTYRISGNIVKTFYDVFTLYRNKDIDLFLVYDFVLSADEIEDAFMETSSIFSMFLSWFLNLCRMGFNNTTKMISVNRVFYKWCRDIPFFDYSKIESVVSLNRRFSLFTQEFKQILSQQFSDKSYSDHDILAICKHLAAHKLYRCDYFITSNQILLANSLTLDKSHHISIVSVEEFSFLSDVVFET